MNIPAIAGAVSTGSSSAPFPAPAASPNNRWRRSPLLQLAICAALAVAPAALLQWPAYDHTDICRDCGTRRDDFALRTRPFDRTLHHFHQQSSTTLSRALAESKGVAAHEHHWVSGSPGTAPVGEERATTGLAEVVEAPRVEAFIRALGQHTPAASRDRWLGVALDPAFGSVFEQSLRYLRFPEHGFESAAEFQRWWKKGESALLNRLRETTEED